MALAILAMSLGVFLEVQASSLNNAARSRDLTIAAMLTRSKMIDIEQKLLDEGFTLGEVTDDGDFEEEGHADYKWHYRVAEIEMDLSGLSSLCGDFEDQEDGDDDQDGGCASMLGSFGGSLEGLTDDLGRSLRLVELTVIWHEGKYEQSMPLRALVTRDDFKLGPGPGFLPNPGTL